MSFEEALDTVTACKNEKSSLEEIAKAFGDVGEGEHAQDPTNLWDNNGSSEESWVADFSSMTATECADLVKGNSMDDHKQVLSVSAVTSHGSGNNGTPFPLLAEPSMKSSNFQLRDPEYISRLERRLDKLYEKKGQADKRSMLKQLKHRTDNLFNSSAADQTHFPESNGLSHAGKGMTGNLVSRRMFPEQALTAEEKLKLIKHDQLQHNREDQGGGDADESQIATETCNGASGTADSVTQCSENGEPSNADKAC